MLFIVCPGAISLPDQLPCLQKDRHHDHQCPPKKGATVSRLLVHKTSSSPPLFVEFKSSLVSLESEQQQLLTLDSESLLDIRMPTYNQLSSRDHPEGSKLQSLARASATV
jgi:hypothetical protein